MQLGGGFAPVMPAAPVCSPRGLRPTRLADCKTTGHGQGSALHPPAALQAIAEPPQTLNHNLRVF
jgi:hypothetical protein